MATKEVLTMENVEVVCVLESAQIRTSKDGKPALLQEGDKITVPEKYALVIKDNVKVARYGFEIVKKVSAPAAPMPSAAEAAAAEAAKDADKKKE